MDILIKVIVRAIFFILFSQTIEHHLFSSRRSACPTQRFPPQFTTLTRSEQCKSKGIFFARKISQHRAVFIRAIVRAAGHLCPSLMPTLILVHFLFSTKFEQHLPVVLTSVCVPDTMFHVSSWHNARRNSRRLFRQETSHNTGTRSCLR